MEKKKDYKTPEMKVMEVENGSLMAASSYDDYDN